GRRGGGKLLGDRAQDALGEVLGRLPLEELRPELRDARVVDPGLELGVGVDVPLLRFLERRGPPEGVAGNDRDAVALLLDLEAIVKAHGYAFATEKRALFAFLAAAGVGVTMPCARRLIAPENSEPASPSTAGLPRLTRRGPAGAGGTPKLAFTRE